MHSMFFCFKATFVHVQPQFFSQPVVLPSHVQPHQIINPTNGNIISMNSTLQPTAPPYAGGPQIINSTSGYPNLLSVHSSPSAPPQYGEIEGIVLLIC